MSAQLPEQLPEQPLLENTPDSAASPRRRVLVLGALAVVVLAVLGAFLLVRSGSSEPSRVDPGVSGALNPDAGKLRVSPVGGSPLVLSQVPGSCETVDASGAVVAGGGAENNPLAPPGPGLSRRCSFPTPLDPAVLSLGPGRASLSAPDTTSFTVAVAAPAAPTAAPTATASPAAPAASPAPPAVSIRGLELVFDTAPPGTYGLTITGNTGGVWYLRLVVG